MNELQGKNKVTNMSNASSPYDSIESTLNESYNDINEGKSYADNYLILLFHSTRRRLLFILMLFFFVFSLLVNSLSFIVLMRRVFFLNAYAFGQRCLCVLDIGFALVVTMGYVIQGVLDNDYGDWDTNLCLTIRTIGFIVASISNWTIVYLSTIRYASLRYPHQLQSKRFREASYATLWIISFVISLFYVTFIFNMESCKGCETSTITTDTKPHGTQLFSDKQRKQVLTLRI
ncbi:hypothetical protein BsWGS_11551 [Bradybaena similaris]